MLKNLLLLAFSLFFFGNIFAFGALYIFTGENMYGEGYARYKATLEKAKQDICHVPHPFLGQLNCDDMPVDQPISKGEPLLRMASESTAEKPIRVLVLGGSVAAHLSKNVSSNKVIPPEVAYNGQSLGYEQILQTVLNAHFDTDRFVVDNAALPGGKQPQQLFKLHYLLMLGERYDIVINVDGFNEIALPLIENRALGNHVAYPRSYSKLVESASTARSSACLVRANDYARNTSWHPLSEVAHLVFIKWCHRAVELEGLGANNPIATVSGYTKADEQAVVEEEVALWQQATQAIAKLAPVYDFAYIHVIQPNQYVAGSKSLSEEEKEKYLAYDHYGAPIRNHYHKLDFNTWPTPEQAVLLDLRHVFHNRAETLYRDACCHLNNKGMALLSEAIAKKAEQVFMQELEEE